MSFPSSSGALTYNGLGIENQEILFPALNPTSLTLDVQVDHPPVVGPIAGPGTPVPPTVPVNLSASFADQDTFETHTAVWSWGDGNTTTASLAESGGTGSVTGSHPYSAPGSYTVILTVTDSDGASGSSSTTVVIPKVDDTTGVNSSVSPSVFGQSVTFTATVSPAFQGLGTPTGTVTFFDGTTALGTGTLSGGSASLTTSAFAVGGHAITALYSGDPMYNATGADAGSIAVPFAQTVNKAATTTSLNASANPWVVGQPVAFTAVVSIVSPGGGVPQGSVTFKNGSTVLGTVPLAVANGADQAVFTTASLPAGTDTVTATYGNTDGNDFGSSASLSQVILGPGVYALGTQLVIVGANTADSAQISPVGSKSDGTTGLMVNSTLNNVYTSKIV